MEEKVLLTTAVSALLGIGVYWATTGALVRETQEKTIQASERMQERRIESEERMQEKAIKAIADTKYNKTIDVTEQMKEQARKNVAEAVEQQNQTVSETDNK